MATRPRRITPTSPSPSPEPSGAPRPARQNANNSANSAALPPQPAPAQNASPEDRQRALLETKVRAIVDSLYQLAVCAADVQEGSEHLVGQKINETIRGLAELDATKGDIKAMIPDDIIEMLDAGRNPDIHTRNFVTRLASENQYSHGQHVAMKEYNSQLSTALDQAFPDLSTDPIPQEKP